jgi:hypothetical protein
MDLCHPNPTIPRSPGVDAPVQGADAGPDDDLSVVNADERTADWSVPSWVRHPRLEDIIGARLTDIRWGHLDALVVRKVAEDLSIDLKKNHYVLDRGIGRVVLPNAGSEATDDRIAKDRFELAKDVTAFANAAGGLIVIGVSDSNGRAERFAEVDLKDKQRLTYLDTLRNWTAPYLSGIEIGHVGSPADPDRGCVLIYVPPSADRPHAVVEPNSHRYTWYVRDGGHAVPLSESQVAISYRDRYAGRADIERRVHTVFDQGVQELDRQHRVWLAMAVVPSKGAQRRHLDRHLLDEFKAQADARQDDLPGPRLGHHASFGRGRVVLRDSPASVALANDHLLHMYADGSAFAAVALDNSTTPRPSGTGVLTWNGTCSASGLAASQPGLSRSLEPPAVMRSTQALPETLSSYAASSRPRRRTPISSRRTRSCLRFSTSFSSSPGGRPRKRTSFRGPRRGTP